MDNPFKSPSIIKYCPGFLGLERGLERAVGPTRTIAFVEIEAIIIENLLAGMESGLLDPAPIWANLKTFNAAIYRNKVHGFIGGYPCQPFSNAGNRKGFEDPRHLYPYIEQHISTARPLWCFFENVAGHLSLGFDYVYDSLSRMGYSVEAGIFTAEEVGAPHQRERLFILAIRKELANSDCIRHAYGELKKYPTEGRQHAFGDITTTCGNVVANTYLNGFIQNDKGGLFAETERSSEGVGNSNNSGSRTSGNGNNGNGKKKNKGREQQSFNGVSEPGKKLGNAESNNERRSRISEGQSVKSTGRSSEELADNNNTGCEEQRKYIATESQQPTVKHIGFNGWPARPGEQQYEWEEPRTTGYIDRLPNTLRTMWSKSRKDFTKMLGEEIWQETEFRIKAHFESEMGCTINGYNFREDLLRAYGNSVVEQTAEMAFIDLLRKHSKL